jgi:hypothetical protein
LGRRASCSVLAAAKTIGTNEHTQRSTRKNAAAKMRGALDHARRHGEWIAQQAETAENT